MTPIEKLDALLADLEHRDGDRSADMCVPPSQRLRKIIGELRPYFAPSASPFETGAPEMSAHFRAWAAICEVLRETRGLTWSDGANCPREAAVAHIRSMAAQCSAQTAAPAERPAGVPPLRRAQIGALQYAIGYLEARDRGAIALDLSALHAWLVVNAPQE